MQEELSEGSKGSEKMPERDNQELEASRRQALLRSLVTAALAGVAPYLCIARMADTEVSTGSSMTTQVREVNVMPQKSYTVIRMHTCTDIDTPKSKKNLENVLYTFRNFSPQTFEPFVCIGRTGKDQEVFAYADDNEFLVDKTGGDDETVLQEVKKKATQREMRSLARFVDLMARAIKSG